MTIIDDTKAIGVDRREKTRHKVRLDVNYRHGDTYLFSRTSDASELGIFLVSDTPLPKGEKLELDFKAPNAREPIRVAGRVAWVETGEHGKEPGMGIQFIDISADIQKRIRALIRIIAYLD